MKMKNQLKHRTAFWMALAMTAANLSGFLVHASENADGAGAAPSAFIASIERKNASGASSRSANEGEPLYLRAVPADPDAEGLAVRWTVIGPDGSDWTQKLLSDPASLNPILAIPKGSSQNAAVVMVEATMTSAKGDADTKRTYIHLNAGNNIAPDAAISILAVGDGPSLSVDLECNAVDEDGKIGSYCWDLDVSDGIDLENCDSTEQELSNTYSAPGVYTIACLAKDDKGGIGFHLTSIKVGSGEGGVKNSQNAAPAIEACYPAILPAVKGEPEKVALLVKAHDADHDPLTFAWKADGGSLSSAEEPISIWTVPTEPGKYTAEVAVSDGISKPAKHYIGIKISEDKEKAPEEDASSEKRTVEIKVGKRPDHVIVDENLNRVFVSNNGSNTVSVIDAASNKVIKTHQTDSFPVGLAISKFDGKVYVASAGSGKIDVIDGRTGLSPTYDIYTGKQNAVDVAVDERRNAYYVTHSTLTSGEVVAIDSGTNEPQWSVGAGSGSSGIGVNQLTGEIFVANTNDDTVSVIDSSSKMVVATIRTDSAPVDIAVNENTGLVYVSCSGAGTVFVVDGETHQGIASVIVGNKPMGMAIDVDNNLLYVANNVSGTVSAVNTTTNTVVDEIRIGGDPTDVAVVSRLGKLFVTLKSRDKVVVVENR